MANNHQEHNARVLADAGGAVMLLEKDCSGQKLYDTAKEILESPERCRAMGEAMAQLGTVDAAEKIYDTIMDLYRGKGR